MRTSIAEKLYVKTGDITGESTEAIVNAANSTLMGGGGVDGAIHKRGGPAILRECRKIRETLWPDGLPTGEAVITTGGELPARWVIHTVGPIYGSNQGRDAELLAKCYENCIELAVENDLGSLAFPSISTGAYGYPKDKAAIVVSAVLDRMRSKYEHIEIDLVFFSDEDMQEFLKYRKTRK